MAFDLLSFLLGKSTGSGGGGGSAALGPKTIRQNGVYRAAADNLDGYNTVTVEVPNSYAAADEGKVVSNGALTAQTSRTLTENGTYDTTLNDEVVVNVPSGGEYTLEDVVEGTISGPIIYTGTKLRSCQFMGNVPITSFIGDSVTGFANDAVSEERAVFKYNQFLETVSLAQFNVITNCQSMFWGCTSLKNVNLPALSRLVSYTFRGCTSLEAINLPSVTRTEPDGLRDCTSLKSVDFTKQVTIAGGETFRGSTKFSVLILRYNGVCPLSTINNFTATPFASGGTGGTLYVPQALIASYQSASNWSTILGYTNNQILPIEGSIYETQYADGTPIA